MGARPAIRRGGSPFQLRLTARSVVDDPATVFVVHLLPALAFIARAKAANAQAGLVVELADVDAGRLDSHEIAGR